jgi:HSP20 family protein
MRRFREHFDQLFENLFGPSLLPTPSTTTATWGPALNLYREGDELVCECALPGCRKEDINVQVTGDVLSISGEMRQEKEVKDENLYRRELQTGRFARAVQLPDEVKADKARAEYRDGILRIRLPLAEPSRHREVRVKVE